MDDYFTIQPHLLRLWYDNSCAKHFLPMLIGSILSGAAAAGAGSLLTKKQSAPGGGILPQLDPRGEEFQRELYDVIGRGLKGGGLTPEISYSALQNILAAAKKGYQETHKELPGMLARIAPREDLTLREYISSALNRQYAREKEGIKAEYEGQAYEDVGAAQNLAFSALGAEKRMAADIASLYNQSILRRSQAPDFASQLWGGIGGAMGTVLAGPIGYANKFSSLP